MAKNTKARSVADLTGGTIIATVEILAPPERVFRAISSSEIVQWWGSDELYRTQEWIGELKLGGRWRASGRQADGKIFSVEGEFVEIDPPRKLVHTWRPDWDPGKPTTVTYRLESIEGGTRVTIRHEGFESPASCAGHTDGWAKVLDWLAGYAAPARTARSFFLIRLLTPRPTFMMDMNQDEKKMMGEHAAFWRKLLEEGVAVAFGPVADPKGGWGVGIIEVDDASEVKRIEANDPAIRSGLGLRYEVLPMVRAIVRP
jgi:uncharacterized protein YndB with AHSA1/START domain/uncharacterized protein YciI